MARTPLVAANWKMHKTQAEARAFVAAVAPKIREVRGREVLVCPPFTALAAFNDARKDTNLRLGAQNLYFETKGAFTGEISIDMLKDVGCEYVIIGHSERRWVFGEPDDLINRKVLAALAGGLLPILCVGEKLDDREKKLTEQVILQQMEKGVAGLAPEAFAKLVVAYEPVWAIGTGRNATTKDAKDAIALIREWVHSRHGTAASEQLRILYGGSVKPDNFATYMEQEGIDGGLIGGASLEPDSFVKLVQY